MPQTLGDQTRYVELRYEGERVIQGTLMRYGDTAEFPWGDKERFESGCFGPINEVDFILDKQHDRTREIGRTGGGGVTLTDSPQSLELRADLLDCTDANDTLTLVRGKVLRGLSVTFRPIEHRLEISKDGKYTIIHKRAELRGGGVVDRPQYKQSTLREQVRSLVNMNEEQIRAMVAELLEKQRAEQPAPKPEPVPAEAIATAVAEAMRAVDIPGAVTTAVDAALEKRTEAERAAEEERMGMMDGKKKKKDMDDDDEKDMAEKIAADVETRADLIVSVKPLLPADFETRGKSNHEILVAAAGDEVDRAEERSDEYLLAKVEGIIERRVAANGRNAKGAPNEPPQNGVKVEEARLLGNPTADINREFTRMRANGNK